MQLALRRADREHGRAPSVEIGFSRQMDVERFETLGGLEKLGGGLGDWSRRPLRRAREQIDSRALAFVLRVDLRCGEKSQRRVERSGVDLGVGSGQCPVCSPLRILGQRHGTLQESGGCGQSAA